MDINKVCPHCMHEVKSDSVCPYCGKNPKELAEIQHQLRPFSILQGKYLVGDVLGEGGFGITYIGLDINLEIPVAIKEFYPNGFVTRESMVTTALTTYSGENAEVVAKWRDNFLGEAKCLAKCAHLPGVVGVKDFFQENNTVYIVQEYLEGQTLKAYVKSRGGKLPVDELLAQMQPVIVALQEVHAQGLIHRDISPDNIMMLKDGKMKVLDFGAARSYGEENEKSKSVLLKPGYAPEEQYRTRGKQGPWSDVYALCATIYKCITGVTPVESMERLREDDLQMPSAMGIPISPQQEDTLRRGMAVIAENRIQSMGELYASLYGAPSNIPAENVPRAEQTAYRPEHVTQAHQTVSKGMTSSAPPKEITIDIAKHKNAIIIGCGAILACIVIVVVVMVAGKNGGSSNRVDQETQASATEQGTPQDIDLAQLAEVIAPAKEDAASAELSEDDLRRLDELELQAGTDGSVENLRNVLQGYLDFANAHNGDGSLVEEQVLYVLPTYSNGVLAHIQLLDEQDARPAIYTQMKIELEEAIGIIEGLRQTGITIEQTQVENTRNSLKENYRTRLIETFDNKAVDDILANGVLSRSVLWSILEGADETDLYDAQTLEDPLRLRYIAARSLHVESEVESLSTAQAIVKIYENLEATEYSPLLLYYLATQCGDANAWEWYQQVNAILMNYAGDFNSLDMAGKRNFIFYYNTYGDSYSIARSEVRNYMNNHFVRP